MAYLAFSEIGGPQLADRVIAPVRDAIAAPRDLSPLEWSVVALARHDPRSSLFAETRFVGWLRGLFGFRRRTPLADARLEALRRMAVIAWHDGYTAAVSEIRAFFRAGYSVDQYESLLGRISAGRLARPLHRHA